MSDDKRLGNKRKSRDKDKNLSRRGREESRRQPSTMTRSISPVPSCSYGTPDPQWSRQPVVLTVASSDDSAGEQSRQTLPTAAPWLQSSESTALSLLPTQSNSLSLQPTQSTSLSLQPTQSTSLSLPSQSTALSLRSPQPTGRRRKRKCSRRVRRSRSSRTNKKLYNIANQLKELQQYIASYAARSLYDSSLPIELSSDSSTDDRPIVQRAILQSFFEEEALQLNQPNTEDQYPESSTQQIDMLSSTEIQYITGHRSFTRLKRQLGVSYTWSQTLPLVPGIEEDQETSDLQSQPEPLELGQQQEALRLLQQQHQQHQQQQQQNQQQQLQHQIPQQYQQHQQHQFCLTQKPPWLEQRLGTAEATEQHRPNFPSQDPIIPEPKQEPEPEHELSEPEEQQQVRKFWHIPQQHRFEPDQGPQQPSQAQRLEPLVNDPLQPGTEQPLQSLGYEPWLQSQSLNPGQQLQQFNQQQWLQSMSNWQQFQPFGYDPRLQQPMGYEQWQQSFGPHQRLQYFSHEQWLQSLNHWPRLPFPSHVQQLPFMSYEQWLASFGPSLGHHVQPLTHRPQHLPFVNEQRHTQLLRPELSTQPLSQLPASLPEHQLGLVSSSPQRPSSLLEQNANQTQLVALDLSRDPVAINRLNMPRVSKRSFSKNTYTGGG